MYNVKQISYVDERMNINQKITEENVGRLLLHTASIYWLLFFVCIGRDLILGELNSKVGWSTSFVAFTGTVGPVFYVILCRLALRRFRAYRSSWTATRVAKLVWAVSPVVPVFGALTLLLVIVIRNR